MNEIPGCASHFADIDGDIMHYLHCGDSGPSLVFLHGMPVSSYTWRHVMPAFAPYARCYAPDMIGMGLSSKPNIGYQICDHAFYLETLFNQLALDDITLYAWMGVCVGFFFAMRYPERIRGLAFYEGHPRAVLDWGTLSLPVRQ